MCLDGGESTSPVTLSGEKEEIKRSEPQLHWEISVTSVILKNVIAVIKK